MLYYYTGLTHIEATVGAIIEIIHAFASCDVDSVPLATKLYVSLLLAEVCRYFGSCTVKRSLKRNSKKSNLKAHARPSKPLRTFLHDKAHFTILMHFSDYLKQIIKPVGFHLLKASRDKTLKMAYIELAWPADRMDQAFRWEHLFRVVFRIPS